MRTIERTTQFKKDFRRELKGRHAGTLETEFTGVLSALLEDRAMELRHRDHALTGNWRGFRDCHVRPDLVLIYEKPDAMTPRLVRLGSHSELGI